MAGTTGEPDPVRRVHGTQLEKPDVHPTVAQMLEQAARGEFDVLISRTFPLADTAQAHAYAEGEARTGHVILMP